jgi:hypothetical protein
VVEGSPVISPGVGTQRFYVYEHWRPDTGLPFYVGKGRGNRADFFNKDRNKWHRRIVTKLKSLGLRHDVRKIFTGLDEEMAFTLEKSQISYWRTRGVELVNLTPGGDGSAGYKWTDEQRYNYREARRTPELRARMSLQAKEAMARPEVKAKHRAAVKAALAKPEAKKNMKAAQDRLREKRRISPRVRPQKSEEEKAKYRAECRARMARPDVMAKHSAKLKAAWARNREARLAAMARPEIRAKLSATIKSAWDRRRGIAAFSDGEK